MKKVFTLLIGLLFATLGSNMQGQINSSRPFNPPEPTLSATQTSGAWYPDRYQPAIFDSYNFNGENVLRLGINQADGAQLRPSAYSGAFYNTQGRKYDLASDITVLYGDLYVPADWATKHRRSDLWATAFKGLDVTDYPIIGFANTEGNNPTFRYWDSNLNLPNGAWVNIPLSINYNSWYKFKMVLAAGQITYYVNGVSVATIASIDAGNSSEYFGNIIAQAYNFNDNTLGSAYDNTSDATYNVYWDNIGTNNGKPITTIVQIASPCGTLDVDIKVSDFKNIGAISLKLNYDPSVLEYKSVSLNTLIAGADVNGNNDTGQFILGVYPAPAITLNDNDILFTLHFALRPGVSGGTTKLRWSTIPGECEYAGPDGTAVYVSTFNNNESVVIPARPVVNTSTGLAYCTIQAAIDAATTGNTITVAAGTYAEDIIVNKSLTILGPNANFSGCSSRVAEAIVVPATNSPADWSSKLVLLSASNVVIKGLTFDGDNPLLGGTGDYNVSQGIIGITGQSNILIENNIIKNMATAAILLADDGYSMTTGNVVNKNKIDNIGPTAGFGIGVYTGNNTYVDITNNCITNVRKGIQGGENNSIANTGNISPVWSGNSIQSYKIGIWNNLAYSAATPVTITGNTVTTVPGSTINSGIEISSVQGTSSVTITNNSVTGAMAGVNLWNNTTTTTVTIGLNTFTDCDYGVFANNFDGYASNAATSSYVIDGTQILNPKIAGVYVKDNSLNTNAAQVAVQVKGNTSITGTLGSAFVVEGADASLSFNGATPATVSGTPKYIVLQTNGTNVPAGNIDATEVIFDTKLGSGMDLPTLFATEDKIDHKIDLATLGFVTVKALNDYVTIGSFVAPNSTPLIKRGVDAALSGWTVNVGSGTFIENVVVTTPVTINGAGMASTTVIPAISAPNAGAGSLPPGASNLFLIQANDVTIQNLTADGNNPAISSGVTSNSIDVDARNGIITDHNSGVYNNLNVNNVTVKNIYLRGMYASSGGSFNFNNNTVTNVAGESASIAMFNYGGSGAFTNNTVSDANDAISSNHSKGTTFSGNIVTNSGSGIHTDNNGDSGGVADDIFGNTVSNSKVNGYGIFVFAAYKAVTVHENTVTNVDVGMASTGQSAAVTPVFSNNVIDGQNKVNSTGIYATTQIWGFGNLNNNTSFINNYVVNNADGFYLETVTGFTLNFGAHFNSITGNSNTNVSVVGTGTTNATMNCNWWGSSDPATIASKISGTVIYMPWLTNGTDSQLSTTGFQPLATCDQTPPVITTCAPAQTKVVTSDCSVPMPDFTATTVASDANPIVKTQSIMAGTLMTFAGSPYTVIITVTDEAGNAVTCTSTLTVQQATISGTLKYYNDAKTPMNKVTLELRKAGVLVGVPVITAEGSGAFEFPNLCAGTYTIHITNNNKDAGGINVTDAAQVNAWSVSGGTAPIEHVKFLAGDVTFNKFIGADDALKIQRYFVFGVDFTPAPKWSYWKKGEIIIDNEHPYATAGAWPTDITVTVSGDVPSLELYGMLTGDFNGSLIPTMTKSAGGSSLTLTQNGELKIGANHAFELPIVAASAMKVGAVSIILQIPSELVKVQDVVIKGSKDPVVWTVKGNELRIGWYSLDPVYADENAGLVTLKLMTTNAFTTGRTIDISLPFNPLNELAEGNYEVIENAALRVARVSNSKGDLTFGQDKGLSLSNYPNPFTKSTTIKYTLPVAGKVTINLYNNLGQLVTTIVEASHSAGQYSVEYENNSLQPGIYVARLRLVNSEVDMVGTIKLIIQK